MDAQHVICAGQVRHANRQTDATCHKSAEFRYMAGATQLPLLEECDLTNSNVLRNAVRDNQRSSQWWEFELFLKLLFNSFPPKYWDVILLCTTVHNISSICWTSWESE